MDFDELDEKFIKEYKVSTKIFNNTKKFSILISKFIDSFFKKNQQISNEKFTLISSDESIIEIPFSYISNIKTLDDMIYCSNIQNKIKISIPEKFLRFILYYIKTGELSLEINNEDLDTLFYYADFWNIRREF